MIAVEVRSTSITRPSNDCPADNRVLVGGAGTSSTTNAAVTAHPIFLPGTSAPYRLRVYAWEVVTNPNSWTIEAHAVCEGAVRAST